MMDRRVLIGWIALGTLGAGIATWMFPGVFANSHVVIGAFLRIGTIMSILWLAYPDLKVIPSWAWTTIILASLIIAVRPRAAFVLLPLMAVAWLLKLKLR